MIVVQRQQDVIFKTVTVRTEDVAPSAVTACTVCESYIQWSRRGGSEGKSICRSARSELNGLLRTYGPGWLYELDYLSSPSISCAVHRVYILYVRRSIIREVK